jgi:hypothetical protein
MARRAIASSESGWVLRAAATLPVAGTKSCGPPFLTESIRRSDMTKQKNLRELFHDTLKDIYFAEKKILAALHKMAKAAQSQELKAAFQKHEG